MLPSSYGPIGSAARRGLPRAAHGPAPAAAGLRNTPSASAPAGTGSCAAGLWRGGRVPLARQLGLETLRDITLSVCDTRNGNFCVHDQLKGGPDLRTCLVLNNYSSKIVVEKKTSPQVRILPEAYFSLEKLDFADFRADLLTAAPRSQQDLPTGSRFCATWPLWSLSETASVLKTAHKSPHRRPHAAPRRLPGGSKTLPKRFQNDSRMAP